MTVREIAALFEDLELRLIESLKRNLARHKAWERDEGFSWAAWQAEKLRHLWRFRRENAAILGEYAEKIDSETQALLKEQFAESADPDNPDHAFFGVNGKKLDALIDEMTSNEYRVEKASLRYMDDIYRKTILRAATAFNAGGVTMQQATDMATKDFLERGINCIEYRDGRMVNIATYAEMALRTCNTRAMLLGEAQRREELGIDTVLVSQYGGCSETCLPWQGLVYIDDVWQPYHGASNLHIGGSYGQSRNGRSYLMLSVAVKAGLFHPNCRHHLTTWIEGVSQRPAPMDKAQVERTARLEKRQRALERRVRKYKRLAAGTLDPKKAKEYRAKVREAQKAVREFVDLHEDVLRRDYWRERNTGGFAAPESHKHVSIKLSASYQQVKPEEDQEPASNTKKPLPTTKYKRGDGSFDLEAAKGDYRKFLQTLPEKYKMYLEMSLDAVQYKEAHDLEFPFAYNFNDDAFLYNPNHPAFYFCDFRASATHEFGHRIDYFCVQSWESKNFQDAIKISNDILEIAPEKFVDFCYSHDKIGAVSDILNAVCKGKYKFPFEHEESYWSEPGNCEKEIFTDLYTSKVLNDKASLDLLTKCFPDLVNAYNSLTDLG